MELRTPFIRYSLSGVVSSNGWILMTTVLVIDDEKSMRDFLAIMLKKEGYHVSLAEDGKTATNSINKNVFDVVISDIRLPDTNGIELLKHCKKVSPETDFILITAYASTEMAVEAVKIGATSYIYKPFDIDELKIVIARCISKKRLERENIFLKRSVENEFQFENIIGQSPNMKIIFDLIRKISNTNSTVLITGESGTGKELVAKAVHYNSVRKDNTFVSINCGAMPENLLESELFGHVKGAFTGAIQNKKGLFEVADKGTIFLDEIGEMNHSMQVKLLHALQDKFIRPVGGTDKITVDVRVIAATNQDLQKAVEEGKFREDLFYRVNVIPIKIPPLRDRKEDIHLLAEHFVPKYSLQSGKQITRISSAAMKYLENYDWPGNVRELQNAIERAIALESTDIITPDSLPEKITHLPEIGSHSPFVLPENGIDLEGHIERIRKEILIEAMRRCNGVQKEAAKFVGMSFRSFRYYAKKYKLNKTLAIR
jgi:two-component system response regulator PilR (NtrC family)